MSVAVSSFEALREVIANFPAFICVLDREGTFTLSVDARGRFVYANRAFCTTFGYSAAELATLHVRELFPADVSARVLAGFARLVNRDEGGAIETTVRARDGRTIVVSGHMDRVVEPGKPPLLRGIFRDITAQRALEARLLHQSRHDALTGLPNRAHFLERLDEALARAARRGTGVALFFLDLDGFKGVNDGLGHAAGDLLLMTIGARLRECLRLGDTVARLGGDEFTILLEDSPAEAELAALAGRIGATVARPVFLGDAEGLVSASIGIARTGSGQDDPQALLAAADAAMYRAKGAGRGCWAFASE